MFNFTTPKRTNNGFTLVELLIVVIILAILAAIVVPQFSASSDDAKAAAADSTLANILAAIDLYKQQHGDYPSAVSAVPSVYTCGGTAGTGAAASEAAFLSQLGYYTASNGEACSKSSTDFKYGPYMNKTTMSADPFTGSVATVAVVAIASAGDLDMGADTTPAAGPGGWKIDPLAGKFIINLVAQETR